jgi:AraC-like DNA-binding protein
MLTSSLDHFTDPCAYQDALQSAEVEVLLTQRGDFRAELTRVDLDKLSLQSGRETMPRVGRGAISAERTAIYFLLGTDQAGGVHCGVDFSPGEIVVSAAGSTYHHLTSPGCRWADVSLSPEDLAAAGSSLGGRQLAPSGLPLILRPRPTPMSWLAKLHSAADSLARTAPDRLARPDVARALEQGLIHAIVSCLVEPEIDQRYPANRRQRTLLARFEELLVERCNEPLHLTEICAAIGAPERTLRACCQQHLGMGPIRFLWLRRMHLAHQELLRADPTSTTVTSIATGQGFWEFGKFSVAYRSLFGESPSATLRRREDDRATPKISPFARPFAVSA